jgi:hypothetical protein
MRIEDNIDFEFDQANPIPDLLFIRVRFNASMKTDVAPSPQQGP